MLADHGLLLREPRLALVIHGAVLLESGLVSQENDVVLARKGAVLAQMLDVLAESRLLSRPMPRTKKTSRSEIALRNVPEPPRDFPAPPDKFSRPTGVAARAGKKVLEGQKTLAPDVIDELVAASGHWTQTFGAAAPAPDKLIERLQAASAWESVHSSAAQWQDFSQRMRLAGWDAALRTGEDFQGVLSAITSNAALRRAFKQTLKFFGGRSQVAARAARTKKKNDKNAKKTAGAQAKA